MKKVAIITSATYNHFIDRGAYGCVVITGDKDLKLDRCLTKSTMPRAELMALIRALEELQLMFPDESLEIELSSKLSYLTSGFSPGKLRSNVGRGPGLGNYDLWKRIFDLGNKHVWFIVAVDTIMIERYHAMAKLIAEGSAKTVDPIEDTGSLYSKKKPRAKSVMDVIEELQEPNKGNSSLPENPGHPIIESNDPPF